MADSRPSSTDEKATVVMEHKSKGFFSRNKTAADDEKGSIDDGNVVEVKETSKDIPPISFTELFRCVSRALSCEHVLIVLQLFNTVREIPRFYWTRCSMCIRIGPSMSGPPLYYRKY